MSSPKIAGQRDTTCVSCSRIISSWERYLFVICTQQVMDWNWSSQGISMWSLQSCFVISELPKWAWGLKFKCPWDSELGPIIPAVAIFFAICLYLCQLWKSDSNAWQSLINTHLKLLILFLCSYKIKCISLSGITKSYREPLKSLTYSQFIIANF